MTSTPLSIMPCALADSSDASAPGRARADARRTVVRTLALPSGETSSAPSSITVTAVGIALEAGAANSASISISTWVFTPRAS